MQPVGVERGWAVLGTEFDLKEKQIKRFCQIKNRLSIEHTMESLSSFLQAWLRFLSIVFTMNYTYKCEQLVCLYRTPALVKRAAIACS